MHLGTACGEMSGQSMRTQSCEQTRDRVCKVTVDEEYWF